MPQSTDNPKRLEIQYGLKTLLLLPLVVVVFMLTFYRFHVAITDLRISQDRIRWTYGFSVFVGILGAIPSFRQRKFMLGLVVGIAGGWAAALAFMVWGVGIDITWIVFGH